MQVIQWSVGGREVVNRCRHLFGAYKYFKLGKTLYKFGSLLLLCLLILRVSYDVMTPRL